MLASNPEGEIQALLTQLELPFEASCLDFYKRKNTVATASAVQVREIPHTRSVNRWQNFAELMGPVRKKLARAGVL